MRSLLVLFMTALMFLSCSKEQEKPAEAVDTEKNVVEELKAQTVKNPKDIEAWFHLADVYDRNGMYQEEIASLRKILAIDPEKDSAYVKLANAHSRLGQYQDAIKNYTKAIHYFPKNPVLYNNLAVAYGKIGKMDEEITALEKAISLRPKYTTARYNLAIIMLKKGKRELALKQYAEINKFDAGAAAALKKEIDAKGK